ncbi:MAG: phosphatase PAP2 family protein [Acidimicrobiales bacterium]|jgi:undecaprenyl-diphosphatase|nr:phosphatase PAP2 family protein [Acidimicrobiales bacterium]|tara:strand:- start:8170 stop:8772 length:603 start_codon:yes stop_codon:yes gene_type:complete
MSIVEGGDLIPFPTRSEFEDTNETTVHPLGPAVAAFDKKIDLAWERFRGQPVLDKTFYLASELADFSVLWHIMGLSKGLTGGSAEREAIRLSAALIAESGIVNGILKSLFKRERPNHVEERPHGLRQPLTSSFPSGHASAAFLAATLLSERSKFKPLWYGLAGIVATSRIHVRIHHASDVIAGTLVGLGLSRIVKKFFSL